ncbi:MAG: tryptophanase [Candidatus Marinimicrobia bacterium]|nr:tryptophanase [Candidatus Neomarinimicrobiota bacterium]
MAKFPIEPFRIKVVEPIKKTNRQEREQIIKEARYNIFNIDSEKVYVDLLTDSGTGAMSDNQWAGIMLGDEAYANCRNWKNFERVLKEITGLKHIIPTHQGRAAETLLFGTLVRPGMIVPNNNHFDTTFANIMEYGGDPQNFVDEPGKDTEIFHPFKGNINIPKLDTFLAANKERVPIIMLTVTNNSGGGQPVSMENIRQVRELADKYHKPFFFDACRFAENAYFIKTREKGYENKSVRDIVREMFSYVDGATMSAKKDGMANMGGFVAVNDDWLADKLREKLILKEGFLTYGGLSGRDLEALARGFEEVLQEDYLEYRIGQVRFLGELLEEAGIPFLKPTGGHAVYLDAKKIMDHIPQNHLPAQSLVVELYKQGGIRSVEIGSFMFAVPDRQTGEIKYPALELVRLALPRRVYTNSHLFYVAEVIREIYGYRHQCKGMKIVAKGESSLRHFVAELEYIE